MRPARGVLLILLLLVPLLPVAVAHGDAARQADTITLAPGESVSWTREVHWHRLMGSVDATERVAVSVQGPDGVAQQVATGTAFPVDHLVACCRAATWTEHTVRLTNVGEQPAQVRFDLVLLHDNLAVVAHDAEVGAWWQTLAMVGLLIGIPAWRARQPALDGDPGRWLRRSRAFHGAAWGVAMVLSLVGMLRFASLPLTGSLGATAWVPSGVGGFFNTHSFVMLVVMALWGAGVACWAGARRRAGSAAAYRWDGLAFAVGSLIVGALMVVEYGRWLIPSVLGLVPAVAFLVDARWRSGTRTQGP